MVRDCPVTRRSKVRPVEVSLGKTLNPLPYSMGAANWLTLHSEPSDETPTCISVSEGSHYTVWNIGIECSHTLGLMNAH